LREAAPAKPGPLASHAVAEQATGAPTYFLDPIDRITEILFGIIMVLTITSTISVYTAGRAEVATMILAALGCNLAWGIIDGGFYLMGCLEERGRQLLTVEAVRQAPDAETGRRAIADVLPDWLTAPLSPDDIEPLRRKLHDLPKVPARPRLGKDDWLGALGVCLLVFGATIPLVIPFLIVGDVQLALRISNGVGIVMLFLCGYAYAKLTGLRPWVTGICMVVVGAVLISIAIALGG
jgi:hypothetical protein